MNRTFRTALIGCGQRGRAHAVGLKEEQRCEVVAITDVNRGAAEALNSDFGFGAAIYEDYREMLLKEKPEVVVVCLWTRLHLPVFRDCVNSGARAVHCEKPMAHTWNDCLEMARIAEESGCQLTFSHQRRFAKGNMLVREMINKGLFGELLRMDLYSPPNLLDCGTHTIDQAFSFNNETPVKWVLGAVDASDTLNWFDVRSEITAVGTLVFENGVRANIQAGGPDQDMWGGVRVIGRKGFIEVFWDGNFGQSVIYDDPSWKPEQCDEEKDLQTMRMVKDIYDCLISGREPELSYKKALRASEVIFAFYESVRLNKRIELPLKGVTDNPFITMYESGRFAAKR